MKFKIENVYKLHEEIYNKLLKVKEQNEGLYVALVSAAYDEEYEDYETNIEYQNFENSLTNYEDEHGKYHLSETDEGLASCWCAYMVLLYDKNYR